MSIRKINRSLRVRVAVSALALFGFGASATANAENVTFKYHPDELETSYGLKTLYGRIQNTAENHCTSSGRKSLATRAYEQKCSAALENDFIVQIDDSRLYAYANRESGWSRLSSNR